MDEGPVNAMRGALKSHCEVIENQPIRRVAALLQHVDLVVSNDTGIMHVAAAVGTPVLSLFGPTDPAQWAPVGPPHRYIRGVNNDIETISCEQVVTAAQDILRRGRPS
jgi:ADP-heptose:LPS heptosyltransferase